jgi:hypothetical protein
VGRSKPRKLYRRRGRWRSKQERALQYGDFIGAVLEKFWLAVTGFTGKGALGTYARLGVYGALSDTARDWRNKPSLGGADTRIQRFLPGGRRWEWPAEWIRLKFPKYSLNEIECEKEIAHAIQEAEPYGDDPVHEDDEQSLESDYRETETGSDFEAAHELPLEQRVDAAKAVAQYVHPKLASTESKVTVDYNKPVTDIPSPTLFAEVLAS